MVLNIGLYVELRHLEAFQAAEDKLSEYHIISIDDTDFNTPAGGKDKLLTPHLIDLGYIKLLHGKQTVFFKLELHIKNGWKDMQSYL